MRCAYCDYCYDVITEGRLGKAVKLGELHFCNDECLQDYVECYKGLMSVYDLTEYGDEEEEE